MVSGQMNATQWRDLGRVLSVHGRSIFVVDSDQGNSSGKPTLVLLHGYPTSSHDYHKVFEALSDKYRVVVHDHLGFGFSEKPQDYSYAIFEQTDVAIALWQQLGLTSVRVFAHDYGTSIGTELLARSNRGLCPVKIESMVLCNGSVHIELAKLRFIQKLLRNSVTGPAVARLTNQRVFNRNMKKLWHDPTTLSDSDLDEMWQLLVREGGKTVLPRITQYLRDRVTYWNRWVGALQTSSLPLAFIWGADDPIVGANVARVHHSEARRSKLSLLEGVGHYPMLEAPELWLIEFHKLQEYLGSEIDHEHVQVT